MDIFDLNKPQEAHGFVLHPLKMKDFKAWEQAKQALLIRQSTMPAQYAMYPWLGAVYAMEIDNITATGKSIGAIPRICEVFLLALGIKTKDSIGFVTDPKDRKRLKALSVNDGESVRRITPVQFNDIRKKLVEMQGETLPDESENPELVLAEMQMYQAAQGMKFDLESLVSSVAYQNGIRVTDMSEWTIREFDLNRRAIDRSINHMIHGIGSLVGMVKYKDGNPYPSWCFDRQMESGVLTSAAEFESRMGNAVSRDASLLPT